MNVTKELAITLDEESMEALRKGEALQVPVDQEQSIVIYPPRTLQEQE